MTIAQPEPPPEELVQAGPPAIDTPLVELRVIGAPTLLPALKSRLVSNQLGNADLLWSVAESFAPQQILTLLPAGRVKIHCFIDFTHSSEIKLYFVAPRQDRFLIRELELKNQIGTVELESIAQIVELSVGALLTDAEAGISRSEVEAAISPHSVSPHHPQIVAEPTAKRDTDDAFAVSATYMLSQYSKELPVEHGPGIGAFLEEASPNLRQRFGFAGACTIPQRVNGKSASVELDRIELTATYVVAFALGTRRRFFVGPLLKGGFGWVGAKPIAGDLPGSYRLEPSRRDIEGHLGFGLTGAADWFRWLTTELALGISFYPKPIRHEFLVENTPETLTTAKNLRFFTNFSFIIR